MIILKNPLDMHLHLRDDNMLSKISNFSSKYFSGAIIMPNLIPPITTKQALLEYKKRILKSMKYQNFIPYMSIFFKNSYTEDFLKSIKNELTTIKLYPSGITTNSEGGITNFSIEELKNVLSIMSDLNIPLSIHGETNGFVMDREAEFIPIYETIAQNFPNLIIIMEHITTEESVKALEKFDNLYATITVHHLLITLDDVVGEMLNPHLFCKPIAKTPQDRLALQKIVFSGNPKVMFGSDSAPHPKETKEAEFCSAGIFTAPIALQLLTELFEKNGALDTLQDFISNNAQKIYKNLSVPNKIVKLEEQPFKIPSNYNGVIPMFANKIIKYSIVD